MKRYLLFSGDDHYPEGGWDDFQGDFDTIDEAMNNVDVASEVEWFQIIDTQTQHLHMAKIISG